MISAQVKRRQLIRKWPEKLNDVNKAFLPQAGGIVEEQAARTAPRDQGQLSGSIKLRLTADSAIIAATASYAADVEYGTRPHVITAKNARVLTDGKNFFGKTVNHPGTKAQPYLRPALLENKTKILRLWRRIFRSVYGR